MDVLGKFKNYLLIDGRSSLDFNLYISGDGTFSSPEKRFEEIEIPGRNGKLIIDEGQTYNNIEVSYDCFIYPKFDKYFSELKSFLLSRNGYFRLEDTYHLNEYRLATFLSSIEPDMAQNLSVGSFTLTFNCKPQRFRTDGEDIIVCTNGIIINNKTQFISKPLIRCYGVGSFTMFNSYGTLTTSITKASGYTDIDCDIQDAFKDTTNCNPNLNLSNNRFPELYPGENRITYSGFSRIEVTPRWWTL